MDIFRKDARKDSFLSRSPSNVCFSRQIDDIINDMSGCPNMLLRHRMICLLVLTLKLPQHFLVLNLDWLPPEPC